MTAEKTEASSELKYMISQDRQLKINSLKAQIDHIRKAIDIQVRATTAKNYMPKLDQFKDCLGKQTLL